MREVGVELGDRGIAVLERPVESGAVGVAEAVLAGTVQDVQPRPRRGHAIGECAGAVGRGVVDDQDVDPGRVALERLDETVQRRGLVVGRDDGEGWGEGVHERQDAPRCRQPGAPSTSGRARPLNGTRADM